MEPFGRQQRKNKRLGDRPFYEKVGPTSADIVAEARSAVRTLNTRRPCTPTDSKRTLFSTNQPRPEGRPPSALSGKVQYEESTSRPPSGRTRLTPIENVPEIPEEGIVPEPPSTPPGGKPRRSIRSSMPCSTNGEIQAHIPTIASGNPPSSARPNAKIKAAVVGQGNNEISLAFCPSPPKMGSPLSTPPSSAGIIRRNSAGPTPTPPSAIKSEALMTRRVRSGPKERISPRSPSTEKLEIINQSNNNYDEFISYDVSPKKEVQRTSSGDKRKRKQPELDKVKDELTVYHEESVKPLLARMEEKFASNNTAELASDCLLLWNVLEKKSMFGKASGSMAARRRGEILKTLFKFLDVNDSRLVLRLGRLILSMKVTGNNITNICMVIYKLAKTEKNDKMFLEEDMLKYLVEALKDYDILTYRDALIYATGALKHLTNNNQSAQQELLTLDTIQSLARILDTICNDIPQYSRPERHVSNLLIQVTGVLRYLADLNGARDLYLTHGIIRRLGDILNHFSIDEDLVYNISRILSKLTLYNECCVQLCASENCFKALIKALKDFERKQEITVRLCFILGNLTAKNDEARSELFNIPSCMPILLSVMQTYFNLDQTSKSDSSDTSRSQSDTSLSSSSNSSSGYNSGNTNNNNNSIRSDSYEDALVKAIRVIANLSINIDVGSVIASNEVCISMLLKILDVKSLQHSEELVLNTVSTLNNLSFYQDDNSVVSQRHLDITESLLSLLLPENMDAMVEACRVFGNLTRNKKVRKLLVDQKVDEILIALLDAGERETVFTACGVLINLMTDDDVRPKLKEEGGIKKLIDVLHDFGKNDWQLAAMVCQTLWNYSGDITSSISTFGEEETIELIDLLTDYLDEEAMFDTSSMENMDADLFDTLRDMWEDVFCPVGEKLLRRIKSHHSDLVPLESPS